MSAFDDLIADRFLHYLNQGKELLAGMTAYEYVLTYDRPIWALHILALARNRLGVSIPEVEILFGCENDSSSWCKAHGYFRDIREVTLENDYLVKEEGAGEEVSLELSYVVLAECVAKVIYNSSDPVPRNPFDADSGWWIISIAIKLAKDLDDPSFEKQIIAAALDRRSAMDADTETVKRICGNVDRFAIEYGFTRLKLTDWKSSVGYSCVHVAGKCFGDNKPFGVMLENGVYELESIFNRKGRNENSQNLSKVMSIGRKPPCLYCSDEDNCVKLMIAKALVSNEEGAESDAMLELEVDAEDFYSAINSGIHCLKDDLQTG